VSQRAALPLDVQNSYRARYRAMRPGWSSSGEQLEALVRSYLTPGSKVLDLGCGRGGVVELFWKDVKLAVGIDPDVPSLTEHRAHGMPVIRGRGEHLPFAGESFDLIVCLWVLEHLRSPEVVLRGVHRVLRPGGHLVWLEHVRSPIAPVRWVQQLLDPLLVRLEADHLLRDPLDHLRGEPVAIERLERSRLGYIERGVARKLSASGNPG